MAEKNPHIETITVHGMHNNSGSLSDVIQPIHLSTSYERKKDGTHNQYNYTRGGNPNREAVENKIAALECAAHAIAFSSGLAAVNAIFENILEHSSNIIMPDDCYHGTRSLLDKFFHFRPAIKRCGNCTGHCLIIPDAGSDLIIVIRANNPTQNI